jgi:hypothetical protein
MEMAISDIDGDLAVAALASGGGDAILAIEQNLLQRDTRQSGLPQ